MAKYLIFRTDRIGDFITSQVVSYSLKHKSKNNQVDFVVSKYNYNYIKNFKYISNIYIFNQTGFRLIDFFYLFLKIKKKYDFLIVLDGKRRSFFSGIFINSKIKVCFMKDFYPKYLIKIFYNKYLKNSELNIQYKNFEILLNYLDTKIPKKINYYDRYKFKIKKIPINKPYIQLHLDEKWFKGFYYNDFDYMGLTENKIYNLISHLTKNYKSNLIVTFGHAKIEIIDNFVSKFLDINKTINKLKINNYTVTFYSKTDFRDLEYLVKNSKLLICCEGAISHVSHAFNVNTIALIQKNRPEISNFWTSHMSKIKLIYRADIKSVIKQIKKLSINH